MTNGHTEAADLYVSQLKVSSSCEPASFLELSVVRQISLRDSAKDLTRLQDDSSIEEL